MSPKRKQSQDDAANEIPTITPSQAEGDRETVEQALDEQGQSERRQTGRQPGGQGHVQPTPSQAEGDRETVEESLREKERRGQSRQWTDDDSQDKPIVY